MIDRRQRQVALLVAGCFFMEILDGTIVTTSAPQIAASLDTTPNSISIVITAYFVTLATLIPLSGWVAARWGARRVFITAIVIFVVASIGCAASSSLPELTAWRVLQGAGGALMVPVGRLVVLAHAAKKDLMIITAYLIWPALMAPVIAPLAGGLITTHLSWHWLFLINVPLGAIALVAAWRLIESLDQPAPPPLDRIGVLLSCTGLTSLTVTAALLSERHPNWTAVIVAAVASAVLLTAAVRHLLDAPAPLINLRTLRIPTFRASISGSSRFLLVIGAAPFLFPLLFQEVFGWSPVKSGFLVLFLFAGNIGIKPATTYLFSRWGFRVMLTVATAGMAVTMILAAFLTGSTPELVIAILLVFSGIFRSIGGTGYTTIAFTEVPPEEMRDANTLQATVMQLSAGFGVAAATIALTAGDPLGALLPGSETAKSAYVIAFLALAAISLWAMVSALRLHPAAGDILRRPGQQRGATAPAGAREPA